MEPEPWALQRFKDYNDDDYVTHDKARHQEPEPGALIIITGACGAGAVDTAAL